MKIVKRNYVFLDITPKIVDNVYMFNERRRGMKKLFLKHREIISYVIFGVLTFFVDLGVFSIFDFLLDLNADGVLMHLCSITSTILAITFAYVTNRKFVFKSRVTGRKGIIKEITEFYSARILSLVIAEVLMQITVISLGFDAILMKFLINIIVIVLNYIFSKFWVFRK